MRPVLCPNFWHVNKYDDCFVVCPVQDGFPSSEFDSFQGENYVEMSSFRGSEVDAVDAHLNWKVNAKQCSFHYVQDWAAKIQINSL